MTMQPEGRPCRVPVATGEDRCFGGCCRRIWLPFETRAQIAACGDVDAKQISEMLEPEPDQYLAQDGQPVDLNRGLFFRCKNLDEPTGNCTIYETRPAMCREFPNGFQCPVPSCESKEATCLPIHPNRPSRAFRRAAAVAGRQARGRPHRGLAVWNAAEATARATGRVRK